VIHFPNATRVRTATITVAALTLVLAAASPVQSAGLRNCIDTGGVAPCFEMVWANGVQLKMTFANLNPKPANAPTDNFYVMAPQTGTPQGSLPFPHDHVIGDVPPQNHGDYSVHYDGFFVLCSAQGISSGGCVPTMTSIPGLGTIPLAKTANGQMLTSVGPIESAANAGLLTLFDTGGVFVGTINPGK
jgi:hypothetical protein